MTKHTPGPWGNRKVFKLTAVTEAPTDPKAHEANARLRAAAPDMLACIEAFCTAYAPDDGGETSWEALNNVLETALEIRQRIHGT